MDGSALYWLDWSIRSIAHLILGEYVIHQRAVVGFLLVNALDEVEIGVNYVAGAVDGDHGEGGEKEGGQRKLLRPLGAVGQGWAEQRWNQTGGQRPGTQS